MSIPTIELLPLSAVRPSTYNPRTADPKRLELVELSLRKLGFLLPIYADPDGEIVSGHQRHYVAQRIGWDRIPVQRVPAMDLAKRKVLNLTFNRGTNDMRAQDQPAELTRRLVSMGIVDRMRDLPDTDDRFPCMRGEEVTTASVVEANRGRWNLYARNLARTLHARRVRMPVIVTDGLKVINGIGRVQDIAEHGGTAIWIVRLDAARAELAEAMLNYLSMDFDIHTRYADMLRYNSFKWPWGGYKDALGRSFAFGLPKRKAGWDLKTPDQVKAWTNQFGTCVLDFGAGLMSETNICRAAGIDCTPFEPFYSESWSVNRLKSLEVVRAFLRRVAEGTRWHSIFLSAVMNSIPFQQDRRHVVALIAAICSPRTIVYAHSQAVGNRGSQIISGGEGLNASSVNTTIFRLDYEPNVSLSAGDSKGLTKMQKYWTAAEFKSLWSERFASVVIHKRPSDVHAVCSRPKPIPNADLEAAIRFEFDLPYPDGQRMGLVDEAIAAFSARKTGDFI